DELHSRCYSGSSISLLSTRRSIRHRGSSSYLTVPNRRSAFITPTMSRAVSQLSIAPRIPSRCPSVSARPRPRCPTESSAEVTR
ncbi:hypothetical protein Tcan_02085, partial [Toxocara canis]